MKTDEKLKVCEKQQAKKLQSTENCQRENENLSVNTQRNMRVRDKLFAMVTKKLKREKLRNRQLKQEIKRKSLSFYQFKQKAHTKVKIAISQMGEKRDKFEDLISFFEQKEPVSKKLAGCQENCTDGNETLRETLLKERNTVVTKLK